MRGARLYRASEMRTADALAIQAGVSEWELMRAAGEQVARHTLKLSRTAGHGPGTAVVLCGPGNNGGDGYVAALQLARAGLSVHAFALERPSRKGASGAAAAALTIFEEHLGAPSTLGPDSAASVLPLVTSGTVVVDALFGSGLTRPLAGWLGELITALNVHAHRVGASVVSVDTPSGLNADLASADWPHVQADLTVVLAGHKPAGLFYPARASYGERVLVEIGMPHGVLEAASKTLIVDDAYAKAALPARDPAGHKYVAGAVLVVAGSVRYRGAGELACRGAWRAGAGVVTLASDERHPASWPETILEPYAPPAAWPPPGLTHRRAGALVIGPGLDPEVLQALPELLAWAEGPVVLDAAALDPDTLLRARPQLAGKRVVITPHAGEAERLLAALHGAPAGSAANDPLGVTGALAAALGVHCVLKGPTTVIAAPEGRLAVSTRGSPQLASGGTGDVLAGVLGALLAKPGAASLIFERVATGVYLHGVAGELAAMEKGEGTLATDVAEALPHAIRAVA